MSDERMFEFPQMIPGQIGFTDGELAAAGGTPLAADPPTLKTIRMVEKLDGSGARKVSEREYERRRDALELEGADGDETAGTVTYWYRPRGVTP